MEERELSVLLALGDSEEPPTEFMIFHKGSNRTLKGDVVINERALASVFAAEKTRQRVEVPFDYGHAAVQGPQSSESIKASAWGTLAERDGDLWVTAIRWTDTAHEMISKREVRFTSPAVMIDTETNEMRSLTNIALTNLPATIGQKPLVASSVDPAAPAVNSKESSMDEKEVLSLMLSLGVSDAAAIAPSLEALKKEREQLLAATTATQRDLSEAQGRLKQLAEASEKAEHAKIIEELSESAKLPPALKEWAASQTAASLRKFGEGATSLVGGAKTKKGAEAFGTKREESYDESTIKVFEAMGISAEDFGSEQAHLLSQPSFWECDPSKGPSAKEIK